MSEGVILRQGHQAPDLEGYYSFFNSESGPRNVIVKVSPGVDRRHNPTLPPTLCDRVTINVERSGSGLISTFEMPVTEPPRTVEEIANLAQSLADLAVGHADQVFALYQ